MPQERMRVLQRLDKETVDRIIEALSKGYAIGDACDLANIDRKTYYRWLQYAEEPDASDELKEFLKRVRSARANASVTIQDKLILHMATERGVSACLEWLKRQRREDWGDARQPEGSLAEMIAERQQQPQLNDSEKLTRINALLPRMLAEKARIESEQGESLVLQEGHQPPEEGGDTSARNH